VAVRDVLRYPHPALKRVARELDPASDAQLIERVATDLLDTMRAHTGCVGIAAPQLAAEVRMVVVDCSAHRKCLDDNSGELVLVNPVVAASDGAAVAREGCLSIPELTADVRRATTVTIAATDAFTGAAVEVDSRGFEARCLLHEIDHLDGLLFLDRVDSLSRDVFRRKHHS
jgi:peptide deformylase